MARRDVYAASIVDYLSRHEGWSKVVEIARGADVPKGSMYGLMATLVESGKVELRPSNEGGGYQLRAHSDEGKESAKTAPDPSPAPAPASMTGVPLGTEQPADVVAADSPMVEPPPAAGIVPFAGIGTTTFIGYSMSSELRILDNLEQLDDATRERVLQYAVDRWWLK